MFSRLFSRLDHLLVLVFDSVLSLNNLKPCLVRVVTSILLCIMICTGVNAQSSVGERTGLWATGSTWVGGTMPGTIASGKLTVTSKVVVIDGTVMSMDKVALNLCNLTINAGDTLVILGDLTEFGSTLSNNGVLIVFGNVTNGGSNNFISGSGKMVVTGNYSNALGANTFSGPSYVFGSTSGFFPAPTVGDESSLQSSDPGLYNYQQNLYAVLPIELLNFEATLENSIVRLHWTTASEFNNDHFIVERSANGIEFGAWTNVSGAGNSSTIREYEVLDSNPLNGRSYYRLIQVDYDGQSSQSEVVTVLNSEIETPNIYPNPTADFLYFSGISENCSVLVCDISGGFAPERLWLIEIAPGKVAVDLRHLDSGVYLIKLDDSETSLSKTYRVLKK